MNRRNAHWRVSKTARVIAAEMYDFFANDPAFRRLHPDRKSWVNARYQTFFKPAREALAKSLSSSTLSDDMKEEIIDALALDQQFINRKQPRISIQRA